MEDRKGRQAARASPFGVQLSHWRARRQESQLSLALGANVSQRHLSFIETGRAQPSRDMVLRLCDALDIPLRSRNELLVSAGYAAFYPERPLGRSDMQSVREALSRMIERHEPYPAVVVDREWRVVMRNEGAARFVSACFDERAVRALSADGALNLMRMMFEPKQMRPKIRNWRKSNRVSSRACAGRPPATRSRHRGRCCESLRWAPTGASLQARASRHSHQSCRSRLLSAARH